MQRNLHLFANRNYTASYLEQNRSRACSLKSNALGILKHKNISYPSKPFLFHNLKTWTTKWLIGNENFLIWQKTEVKKNQVTNTNILWYSSVDVKSQSHPTPPGHWSISPSPRQGTQCNPITHFLGASESGWPSGESQTSAQSRLTRICHLHQASPTCSCVQISSALQGWWTLDQLEARIAWDHYKPDSFWAMRDSRYQIECHTRSKSVVLRHWPFLRRDLRLGGEW